MSAFVSYFLLLITSCAVFRRSLIHSMRLFWILVDNHKSNVCDFDIKPFLIAFFFNKILVGFKSRWMRGEFYLCLPVFEGKLYSRYNSQLLQAFHWFSNAIHHWIHWLPSLMFYRIIPFQCKEKFPNDSKHFLQTRRRNVWLNIHF